MKIVGRILIALLVVGLLILLGYVAWVYLLPRWFMLLFYAYSLCGLLIYAYGILIFLAADRNSNWAEALFKKLVKANLQSDVASRMNRFRESVAGIALAASGLVVWPVDVIYGVGLATKNKEKKFSPQEYSILQATLPDSYKSIYSLFAVAAILGLTFLRVNLGIYGAITIASIVASASLRHFSYTVGTVSLPARLRRAAANPYALFLVVAASDFSTLVLGLTTLKLHGQSGAITWPVLVATGRALLQGEGALWDIFKGARPTIFQIIVAFVGLLFSIALLKVIAEFGEFRRKDDDYLWLASTSNFMGNFAASLRYLRNLKSWNNDSHTVEIVALLGVNQVEDAIARTKTLLEQQRKPATDSAIHASMVQAFLLPHMPQSAYLGVLKLAVDKRVPDIATQDGVALVKQFEVYEQAVAIFAPVASSYPLTLTRIHLLADKRDEALAVIETYTPVSDLDKLSGQVLAASLRLSDPKTTPAEDAETYFHFAEEAFPLFRKLIGSPLDVTQRTTVFLEIQRALDLARRFRPDRVEELSYLADTVADLQTDEEYKRAIAVIKAQFE